MMLPSLPVAPIIPVLAHSRIKLKANPLVLSGIDTALAAVLRGRVSYVDKGWLWQWTGRHWVHVWPGGTRKG